MSDNRFSIRFAEPKDVSLILDMIKELAVYKRC